MHLPGSALPRRFALRAGVILFGALLLGGCQPRGAVEPVPATSARAPVDFAAPTAGTERFLIDSAASDLRVLVYRGGPLARFGHNHVLRAGALTGVVDVAPAPGQSSFSLALAPADFIVDPPDARAAEGGEFASEPSPQAVDATRANLLGPRVLDAARHPLITLQSARWSGSEPEPIVSLRIGLRGVEREVSLPLRIERGTDRVTAAGTLLLRTSDFGMEPFSVMGGGLRVEDQLTIRFRIVALRKGSR